MKNNGFLGNPGLRIASLVIAFLVWLVIMNVSDPVKTRTFSGIPIKVANPEYLESQDLSYKLVDNSGTVNVTVTANRKVLEALSPASIEATADLTQIINLDSDPVMVPVNVTVGRLSQDSFVVNPRNIAITLEDLIRKEFVISPHAGISSPSSGHEVGSMSVKPEKITLRGPKSLVEKIDTVEALVDVSGLEEDTVLDADIQVRDRNSDILDETQMSSLKSSTDFGDIRVNVQLFNVLTDVPVITETYGEPKQGYTVGEITVTPETVSLAGSADDLAVFRQNGGKIVISKESEDVNISGADSDQEIPVDLTYYIPEGLELATGFSSNAVVTVKILEQDTESFEIETKNIEQKNLPENMNVVFKEASLDVRIRGSSVQLAALNTSDIKAYIDFSGMELSPGDTKLDVQITLPEGYSLASEKVEADVTISRQEKTVTVDPEQGSGG